METIPTHLADIFSSEKRMKIFEVVSRTETHFTPRQIWQKLENDNLQVPISMVFTCLKALHYRGYVKEIRETIHKKTGRGRPEIKYMCVDGINKS